METNKTSFRQFEYCPLCKCSHKKRKKHTYSKGHQTILQNILDKFKLKIQSVRKDIFSPQVRGHKFELGAKFWCYFCAVEAEKHTWVDLTTVVGGGLLEHIASETHKQKLAEFLWQNLLTDSKTLTPVYTLSPEDLLIFQKASLHGVERYNRADATQRRKVADTIAQTEVERRMVHCPETKKSDIRPVATPASQLPGNSGNQEVRTTGKITVGAYARGLASVQTPTAGEGNVHTGATPPWLQSDDVATPGEIGPSIQAYQQHLEQQRRAKLPANRVGANFDQAADPSHNWLPSFGRVWSKGRRLQSKFHFEKQMSWNKSSKKNSSETSTSTGWSRSANPTAERQTGSNSLTAAVSAQPSRGGNNTHPQSVWPGSSSQLAGTHITDTASQAATKPYKRQMKRPFQGSNNGFDWSNDPVEYSPSNDVIPYKRKRDNTSDSRSTASLIQTPVLARNVER